MNIKEVLNLKELWAFWLAVLSIVVAVILYQFLASPIREYVVIAAAVFFILVCIFKFIK